MVPTAAVAAPREITVALLVRRAALVVTVAVSRAPAAPGVVPLTVHRAVSSRL
jgi:hypothetical protein